MFDWDDVRVFLAVSRTGSLTAAGRALGADQSTVGRRLTSFEESLGAKLFFRTPDGFVPTPAGERLAPRAKEMEEEALAIARELAGAETKLTGSIRLTAPVVFGAKVVVPLLARFAAAWPEIEVELIADDRAFNLSKREADMAVRINRSQREGGLFMRRVATAGYGLYASRAYVSRAGTPTGSLTGHTAVGFEEAESDREAQWFADVIGDARVAFRSNSSLARLEAARAGVGITPLPSYLVASEPELVPVAPIATTRTLGQDVWLLVHKDLRHSARIRACADFLGQELARLDPVLRGPVPARTKVK